MFNELKKLNNGRTRVKILAVLLVITLTATNFILLGSYMGETYSTHAADINLQEQDNSTNVENVKFSAYLDEVDRNKNEVSANINSQDLNLFVSLNVQGEGRLENAKINFQDSNFESKENNQVFEKQIETIPSEKGITVKLPIIAKTSSKYNLGLLNMNSKINLTGEYINDNGNITEINTTKLVKVNWKLENVTNEQVVVSQELITNKIFSIDGTNKRIVQILIKSNIDNNIVPVKEEKIEVEVPQVGTKPEQVKVITKSTLATNGNKESANYEYKEAEGKILINVLNNPDENNAVAWVKNAVDEFIVTYVYDENTQLQPFTSKVYSKMKVYGETEGEVANENELTLENLEIKGDIATLESKITNNLYKGNMYIGEDTIYQTKWDTFLTYSELAEKITLEDLGDTLNTENLSTYYKNTKINKAQALNILGEEGKIKIFDAKNTETPITEIELSDVILEEDITVNYEGNVNKIIIETTPAVKEGKLEILNEKAIKVENNEQLENINKLNSGVKLVVKDKQNNTSVDISKTSQDTLLEPVAVIETRLDKDTITNQAENELRLTTKLKTADASNKLFKNPTINIELPKEITKATLENISLVYEEELEIKSSEIIASANENKVLKIELEGEQTTYNAQGGAEIVIDLKVSAEEFMASKNVEIKTTCINNEENIETTNNLQIVAKNGILTKNYIKVGENIVEGVNKEVLTNSIDNNTDIQINSKIINNNGQKITNATLIGTLPVGTTLKTPITNTNIYYSNEENPAKDASSWTNSVENFENIKSFKIEVGEIEQAGLIEVLYDLKLNKEQVKEIETLESKINLDYMIEERTEQENMKFKLLNTIENGQMSMNENFVINIKPKTKTETLHEEQILTYQIEITNISSKTLNNLILDYTIPEGAVYTELTAAQATDIEFTDNEELRNKEWDIEIIAPNQKITKEVTIKIKKGTTQIVNKVDVKDSEKQILFTVMTETIEVKPADLQVMLSRRDNLITILNVGNSIRYMVIVKNNTASEMKNVQINADIPEETKWLDNSEYNNEWEYNPQTKKARHVIESLGADETKVLSFEVTVNKLEDDSCEETIENTVQVVTEAGEQYESNVFKSQVLTEKWEFTMTSEHETELKEGDNVKYIIRLKNIGKAGRGITLKYDVPEEIQFRKLKYYINNGEATEDEITKTSISIFEYLNAEDTLTLEIEGVTYNLDDTVESKNIESFAKLDLGNEEYIETNKITDKIVNDVIPGDPEESEDPRDQGEPGDSGDPKDTETYSISGLAWLDENKNGIRENNEEILPGITVILLDKNGNTLKDKEDNLISATTGVTGTYKFANLEKGEYIVAFVYDTNKYAVTKYQVKDATQDNNSDVISKQINLDNQEIFIGATNSIKLENNDIKNIDLGLIENAKFDLSIEKYVSKVVVTDNTESTSYKFEEETLAKVEISAKKLASSTMLVQYEIKVSNNGDVQGYVGDLIDYLPKGLSFNSEMNPDWYLDSEGKLHNESLAKQGIEPGKTKSVSLVLTKALNNNSAGTIENIAEIGESASLEGLKDIDSTAGNKNAGEDDRANASLIISIKTGGTIMYIGIVLACLLVIGIGIYLIDKKVLKTSQWEVK